MQSADNAWWRNAKIHQSNDVPWKMKCRRMVDKVYSVFFGERKLVMEQRDPGQNQLVGDKSYDVQFQKKGRRNMERISYEDNEGRKNYLEDEASLST